MPTIMPLEWATEKMQYQPSEINSYDLLKHGHDRLENRPIMTHSNVEMYNKQLEVNNSSCKDISRLDCGGSVNNNPNNNNYCKNKHCDVNSHNFNNNYNINNNTSQQSRFFLRDKSYNRRHLLSASDCVLNSDCVTAIERLKSTKQIMTNSEPITPTKECRSSYCYSNNININNNNNNSRSSSNSSRDRTSSCYNRTSQLKCFLHAFIIIFIGLICTSSAEQCVIGIKTPGRTWPANDIVVEYGHPLRILCILNQTIVDAEYPGKNASDLFFFRNEKKMEQEYVRIINSTTIEMFVEKPPLGKDMYHCKLRTETSARYVAVCLNTVAVGYKPQLPTNFTCVSDNWENLKCSWIPVDNYIQTDYTLSFRATRKLYPCPKHDSNFPPNFCLWDISTNPIYRQTLENYTFVMNAKNRLGNVSANIRFHHFGHVIPSKPNNLTVVNKTTESALLYWAVPFPMQNFPPGLHHQIAYQHQWDRDKIWKLINITNDVREDKRYYNLTGLEYANTVYDVRVFMKSAVATGDDKWSKFSDITFRTPARLPGRSPRTDIGSFEIADNSAHRDIYLYWQAIPPYLENGDNFKYQVSLIEENGLKTYRPPNETTRSYAVFKNIGFANYRFQVTTSNVMGVYPNSSIIYVPDSTNMPSEPLAVTKIAFDEGLYELSWKSPAINTEIINYTIFWCENERDRPYQCTGYLDWVHVPRNTTIYNITVPHPQKVYQFAVSSNSAKASSGMIWASCTVIHNKVSSKMKSVWINTIGSDVIDVGWKLDCSDRIGVVEGFIIYYCPIVSPKNSTCKEMKKNTTIRADPHTMRSTVTGLKPYTTYKITIAFWTKTGEGLESDPLYNTTLESAPTSPPQNVQVSYITNSSMFVTWQPPTAMNGVLRYYEVHYSGNSLKVEEATTHVLLKDLLSYKNYTITVTACTVKCSVESLPVYALTEIGVPGKINRPPVVKIQDSNLAIVVWSKPQNPGGKLDYYQVSSPGLGIKNSNVTEAKISIPGCLANERDTTYRFHVRAVNVNDKGEHLVGPWSDIGETSCWNGGPSFQVWIIIWTIIGISIVAFLLCVAYTTKRMWRKCKVMKHCEIKLPPGLADEKLLQKPGEQHIRQSSADSSGCSSAQESVTSSLTSNSHVSNDSGTETDPVTTLQNKLLDSTLGWESSSLRQRNVSGGTTRPGPVLTDARWDSYVKVAKAGETIDDTLSLARSTPNLTDNSCNVIPPQTWSSTGYISMPSSEDISTPNSSPVPHEASNIGGNYSVVGLMPTKVPAPRFKNEETPESLTNALLNSKADAKPNIPYVTLASLDQKLKEQQPLDSLRNLDKLAFIGSTPIPKEPLKPMAADPSNKPYVQTGLIDNLKNPSFNTTLNKLMPKFTSPPTISQQLGGDSSASKQYVAVASIAEIKPKNVDEKLSQQNVNTTDTSSNKPYVQASTVFQMLQDKKHDTPVYWETGGDGDSKSSADIDKGYIKDNTIKTDDQTVERNLTARQAVSSSGDTAQHILD